MAQTDTPAREVTRWLYRLAEHYRVPVAVLLRELRTRQALEVEIGRWLGEYCVQQAERVYHEQADEPDGDGLVSRLTRAIVASLRARERRHKESLQEQAWAEAIAAETQRSERERLRRERRQGRTQ